MRNNQHHGSLDQLYILHLPALRQRHVSLDQQGRGGHVSSGHVIFPVWMKARDPDLLSQDAFCTVFVCYSCCFYNSINMMLFCHPIVSELSIMCCWLSSALFAISDPKYGPRQTIILQMAHGQQAANGMFVLIKCLDLETRKRYRK